VLQGRFMLASVLHLQRPIRHVFGTRESRRRPMHGEQQSVVTIYRRTECFRNADNDLRQLT